MYKIMLVAKEGASEIDSMYKYMTTIAPDGKTVVYEAADEEILDAKVEEMLNGKFAKKDFIIVQTKDYSIDADIVKKVEVDPTP